ncbi:unnamed protein product, partial [Prorocentrum cordatum]
MSDARVKNAASAESMENMVKSCQKEILALKVYSSDVDDVVANGMGFLGGCIQISHRTSEPELRDAVIHELGMPRSIHKACNAKPPMGIPLSKKSLKQRASDSIDGDEKKNDENLEICTVDYERMLLIGQNGATTTECKLAPGPDGMRTAKVHGDDKETKVPNAMCEAWSKRKPKGKGAPLKIPAAAAKKPAGAWGEEERAPSAEEEEGEGGGGRLEPDEVEADDEEAPAAKKARPAAAAASERNCTATR